MQYPATSPLMMNQFTSKSCVNFSKRGHAHAGKKTGVRRLDIEKASVGSSPYNGWAMEIVA